MESARTLRFSIDGMTCAACSSRLERVLNTLPGVARASVNLAAASAEVVPLPEVAATAKNTADSDFPAPENRSPALRELAELVVTRTAMLGFSAKEELPEADEAMLFERRQEAEARRLAQAKNRLIPEFLFSGLLVLVSMGHMLGMPLPAFMDPMHNPGVNALVQLLLTLPVMWSGRDFYRLGIPNLLRGGPNMDSLVAVGTGAAFLYSLWNTAVILLSSSEAVRMTAAMDLYYESVAVLISLISLGKFFELLSRMRTSDALGALMRLTPETALRLTGKGSADTQDEVEEVSLADVKPGDLLQIRPGSRIPVDGVVVRGASAVDASMLTGESMPVEVGADSAVTGGTLNTTGVFVMQAQRVGADTAIARMARMVREAQGSKAPIARMADTVSLWFVPAVMMLALASGFLWYLVGNVPASEAMRVFVAVLVVACPCALGLATPMSIMVATGRGASLGVLIKTGAALESAGRVTTVVFDKTGTLTQGQPEILDVLTFGGRSETQVLRAAASLEAVSEHPLAEAVVRAAASRNIAPAPVLDVRTVPGRGILGSMDGNQLVLGNLAFLQEHHIALDGLLTRAALDSRLRDIADAGRTALLLAVDGRLEGILAAADSLRPESIAVVKQLRSLGLHVLMLSGDNQRTAQAVARDAGISDVVAEVLPDGKEAVISRLQKDGQRVAMVGDGVNDAPALARADVGLVVSTGIDVAVEAGDMVLLGGDGAPGLRGVLTAITLGRATLLNIRENLLWAFGYNVLLIPVAAGVLKLFGGPSMSPMLAGAAMALSSVSVVLNALRLRRFRQG